MKLICGIRAQSVTIFPLSFRQESSAGCLLLSGSGLETILLTIAPPSLRDIVLKSIVRLDLAHNSRIILRNLFLDSMPRRCSCCLFGVICEPGCTTRLFRSCKLALLLRLALRFLSATMRKKLSFRLE